MRLKLTTWLVIRSEIFYIYRINIKLFECFSPCFKRHDRARLTAKIITTST